MIRRRRSDAHLIWAIAGLMLILLGTVAALQRAWPEEIMLPIGISMYGYWIWGIGQ